MSKFFFGTPSSGMSCNEIRLGDDKISCEACADEDSPEIPEDFAGNRAVALHGRVCQRVFFFFFSPKRFKIHRRDSFEMMTRH